MDDTIVLWEIPVQSVWEDAVNRYRKELGDLKPEELYRAIRATSDWYWSTPDRHREGRLDLPKARREIGQLAFLSLGRTDMDLAVKIADAYTEEREKGSSLAPGTKELLKDLRRRGIKLGLVTNGASDTQRAKIEKYNLAPYFDYILIEGEFEYGKPDERVFRHVLGKLNAEPSKTWMVGDNLEFDIAPCRPLGIYSIWVNGNSDDSKPLDGVRPDKIIHSISEIRGLI
jgi:putative hydrolase of the HAD superfamily